MFLHRNYNSEPMSSILVYFLIGVPASVGEMESSWDSVLFLRSFLLVHSREFIIGCVQNFME